MNDVFMTCFYPLIMVFFLEANMDRSDLYVHAPMGCKDE